VTWRFAPMIGLVVLLCPALARAQTNLDQGKTPGQIFATVCVECHKEARGLAKGRSSAALADFLREHYTTNGQQAAALAAYVAGGRGADAETATQGRGPKPAAESASVEEPKSNRQGKLSPKPDDRPKRNPAGQTAKPGEQAVPNEQPTITRPVVVPPAATAHNRRKEQKMPTPPAIEPDTAVHAPAAAAAEPAPPSEPPGQEQSPPPAPAMPAEAVPANSEPAESGENAPVPRDHIPD
jgi:hypothetical protein